MLAAVGKIFNSVGNKLANNRIKWFTDNPNVVRILQVGSRKQHLQDDILKTHSIRLEPEWLPREDNTQADYLSRIVDWMTGELVGQYLFYYV